MSLFDRMFSSTVSDLRNPRLWLQNSFGGARTTIGDTVTSDSALGLSAYYAAIRAISEDVGKLPLVTYRRLRPRGKERAVDHPVYRLLHEAPNPEMESMAFRELLQHWAMGWGNGYAEIEQSGADGQPLRLWPIHPIRVNPIKHPTRPRGVLYEVLNDDNTVVTMPPELMLHIKGLGPDQYRGYSVARIGAESVGTGLALETFGNQFFGNGTHMTGVLRHPNKLKPEKLDLLRSQWSEMHTGLANTLKPAILEDGMEWQKLGIEPEAAQFLGSKQFSIEEMARWFRITPHKLQHLQRSTFNNIESLSIQYVDDTLMPWLVRWEQQIRRKLFAREVDEEFFAEHLVLGLLRGDSKARSEYYNRRFHIGTLSQNDIRELENENPIGAEGDVYYVPLNMQRSEDAAAEKEEPAAAPQSPPAPPERDEEAIRRGREEQENEPEQRDPRGMIRAFEPVFRDAFGRLLAKEEKAVARAAKKHEGAPEAWAAWHEAFYAGQEAMARDVLRAPLESVAAALRKDALPPLTTPSRAVEKSKIMARAYYEEDPGTAGVELKAWNAQRDNHLALALLKEICDGIATTG